MHNEVAVLLGTYNGERYLRPLLDSLLNQTYNDFVCYIHDDGSNDNTIKIIDNYQHRFSDKFVILNYPSAGSSCKNFMGLLSRVKEPYVAFCDQDDVWNYDKIQTLVSRIKEVEIRYPNLPVLVFSDLNVVDENLNIMYPSFIKKMNCDVSKTGITDLMKANCAPGCAMMINSSLIELANQFQNIEKISMHDMWCMMIASAYGKIEYLDIPTIKYRQHGNNVIGIRMDSNIEKLKSIFHNNRIKRTKKSIKIVRETVTQVAELYKKNPALKSEQLSILRDIVKINNSNKIKRMIFYRKYGIYRGSGVLALLCC